MSLAHFRRLGRADETGYWIGALGIDVHPVEPRHARRGVRGRVDPGARPFRRRHHLPGRDDRAGRRADHGPAGAGCRVRRSGDRRRAGRCSSARRWGSSRPPVSSPAASSVRWSGCSSRPRWPPSSAPLGTTASAERFAMPGTKRLATMPRALPMSTDLVPLAIRHVRGNLPDPGAGFARAGVRPPAEGRDRLPPARRAGGARGPCGGGRHGPNARRRPAGLLLRHRMGRGAGLPGIIVWRRNLLLGLLVAVAIVVVARATGLAGLPPG